jgi:uncharacterized protein (TIGR02266 family)
MTRTGTGSLPLAQEASAERRKSERTEVVVRVDYRTVDELFSEFVRNINEGGLFVESEAPPPPGTAVDLQFTLPGSEDPLEVRAHVVRASAGEAGEPRGMGLEFEHLDGAARQRINELVRALRA